MNVFRRRFAQHVRLSFHLFRTGLRHLTGRTGKSNIQSLGCRLRRMNELSRAQIRDLMAQVLKNQDKELPDDDSAQLREIGFRSLDFSELALRVEDETGEELNFDAPGLRRIATVSDVLDFLVELQQQ